jgi:hypothetical protein
MFDELEENRKRTLMKEFRETAESERPDESRRIAAIEAEAQAAAQAEADKRAERVRAITAKSWAHVLSRPEISDADRAERRFRVAQRRHTREERERKEASEVRAWLERRNYEDNYRRSEPVAATRAESVGDEWADWNRWCDARIEKYIATRVEQLVARRVEESMRQVYREMSELAEGTYKAIEAIGQALDKQADVIRELGKREETGTRSSDIPRRPMRVVN